MNLFVFENYLRDGIGVTLNLGFELEFYLKKNIDIIFYNQLIRDLFPGSFLSKEIGLYQYEFCSCICEGAFSFVEYIQKVKNFLIEEFNPNFKAKPFIDRPGNAMHFNITLNSRFLDENSLYAIGGMLSLMQESMLFFADKPESYLRYRYYDINTPTTISWGNSNNRTVAIRFFKKIKRIEHRVSCADANPKNSLSAIIASIIYGIKNRTLPPDPIYGVASDRHYDLVKLPIFIADAIKCDSVSSLMDIVNK